MLTPEQRAAIQRVIDYMDHMYPIASPYHGCTDDVACLRALLASPPAWEATAERRAAIAFAAEKFSHLTVSEVLRAMIREVEEYGN